MKIFSIKLKFTIIAVLICFFSFGVAAFLSTQWLAEEIQDDYKEKAMLMGTYIIHDLETSMVQRIHQNIFSTLDIYKTYKEVKEVRIFNLTGKEVFGQEQGPAGAEVGEVLRTGEPIHFYKKIGDRSVTTFVFPIRNKPECHTCHGKRGALRGALLLSLNQEEMEKYIGGQKQKFFILFGLIAITTIGATLITVKRFFLNPLRSIQKGAESIESGNLQYQIPVRSNDEIGLLAKYFNNMAQTLQRNFKELEEKSKQLQEQLTLVARSQKEWQETFNCITDPIAVMSRDCTILKANKAFQEMLKEYFFIPGGEVINKKCNELFGTCLLSNCPHKISMEDKAPTTREIHSQKTGKVFEVSIFLYSPHNGDFIGSVAILKDVTKKKESEMRLIMNERLAALGEMASGIAHELNNPLATISVCTEGLLNRVGKEELDTPLFENYLRMIEEEIQRCKNITTGMLSFVRRTNNDKREIDIHEVLNKAIELINFQGRLKEVVVLRDFQNGVPMVLVNEGELIQVFTSIIVNALDAMEDKGTLAFATGIAGNIVFVKIRDTGPGISPGLINRIFDPFFTTKSEKGGTGLGLSIVDKIIKENNGGIDVTSEEGRGTTFTITLPI